MFSLNILKQNIFSNREGEYDIILYHIFYLCLFFYFNILYLIYHCFYNGCVHVCIQCSDLTQCMPKYIYNICKLLFKIYINTKCLKQTKYKHFSELKCNGIKTLIGQPH